jgi:hypothetical protein
MDKCVGILIICVILIFSLFFMSSITCAFPFKGVDMVISGRISETYDDNINYEKDNRREDFITRLSLNISGMYEGKRRALLLTGNIKRGFHSKYKDIKDSLESLTLKLRNEFSEYSRINLKNTYTHQQAPVSFEEEFGRVIGRYDSYRNNFNLEYTRDVSEHFLLTTTYANGIYWSSRIDSKKSYNNKVGVSVTYFHDIDTSFFVRYSGSRTNYEGGERGITNHTFAAGTKKYVTKRLFLDAGVGANYLPTFGFTSSYIDGSLTDEIDKRTIAVITFFRGDYSVSDRRDIFSNWRITGDISKQLSKELNSSFSIFYGQGEYEIAIETNKLIGLKVNLSYEFNENLSGELAYSYSNFISSIENAGYFKNTMFFAITMSL